MFDCRNKALTSKRSAMHWCEADTFEMCRCVVLPTTLERVQVRSLLIIWYDINSNQSNPN